MKLPSLQAGRIQNTRLEIFSQGYTKIRMNFLHRHSLGSYHKTKSRSICLFGLHGRPKSVITFIIQSHFIGTFVQRRQVQKSSEPLGVIVGRYSHFALNGKGHHDPVAINAGTNRRGERSHRLRIEITSHSDTFVASCFDHAFTYVFVAGSRPAGIKRRDIKPVRLRR